MARQEEFPQQGAFVGAEFPEDDRKGRGVVHFFSCLLLERGDGFCPGMAENCSRGSEQFVDTQIELDVSVRIESHIAPEVHPLSPERFHTKSATEGEFVHFQCF